MGRLTRRLELLERRRPMVEECPGHREPPLTADLRESLRAFSPDAEDRAAYQAEQEALAATPPCARCGWRPEPIFVRVAEDWGQLDSGDGDAA
jgi:hypothetical protein